MIIKNGTLLQAQGGFANMDLQCDTHILSLGKTTPAPQEEEIDGSGYYVVPGLIDIHTHGAMGKDASDGKPEDMAILSNYYASQGVTAWCPTTMTLPESVLTQAVTAITAYKNPVAAKPLGIYMEGPFFHYDKRGAQAAENLADPQIQMFQRLQDASGKEIVVLALAPELEGAKELVDYASKQCTVSLGHTTADYDCACDAYDRGASLATHLYNGMPPFTHRAPGVVGAAFDKGAFVELICDGMHIHPSMIRSTFQLFGKKLVLISDSLRCAGMPDGDYVLGGQPIVKKNGVATLLDGTLAGSSIGLLEGVCKVISFGIPAEDAFYAASTAPATAIGKQSSVGSLEVGKCADFLLLDKDFKLLATYVDGKKVYQA